MLLSGMSMEAFESSIRAIVREALGQRPGPSGLLSLQSCTLVVVRDSVPLLSNFGLVIAPSGGPAVSEMIDRDVPGKKKTGAYTSIPSIHVCFSEDLLWFRVWVFVHCNQSLISYWGKVFRSVVLALISGHNGLCFASALRPPKKWSYTCIISRTEWSVSLWGSLLKTSKDGFARCRSFWQDLMIQNQGLFDLHERWKSEPSVYWYPMPVGNRLALLQKGQYLLQLRSVQDRRR